MRLAAATLLATSLLAAPAEAGVVSRATPLAGPVLAGGRVVWTQAGGTVMAAFPGRRARELARLPPATEAGTARAFVRAPWALAAARTGFVALARTTTRVVDPNYPGALSRFAVIGAGGLLAGGLPPRGDGPCEETVREPESVAAGGGRIAFAETTGTCGRPERVQAITVLDGAERQVIEVRASAPVRRMRLAGRYLALILDGKRDRLVVADLERGGAEAGRIEAGAIADFDIDARGRFAFTYGLRRHPSSWRLGWTSVERLDNTRLLARGVRPRGVALADGRVLFQRGRSLLLRRPGGSERTLHRFTRPRAGGLDLEAGRAVWAERGRIVSRAL